MLCLTAMLFCVILCWSILNSVLTMPVKDDPESKTMNEVNPHKIMFVPVKFAKREVYYDNSLGDIGDSSESFGEHSKGLYVRPEHPLSNYADSYDRFPTIF